MSDDFRNISLGWQADQPDVRDLWYADVQGLKSIRLPAVVDLRPHFGPVNSQGSAGSCTAQAASDALEYLDKLRGRNGWDYSRLFIYYNSRILKGSDTGAMLRDVFKSLEKYGACKESIWPYVPEKFAVKPPPEAYADSQWHQTLQYMRVNQKRAEIQQVLAEGFPIEFGFSVYDSFYETGSDGMVAPPSGSRHGGHAVLLVGYDNAMKRYIVRNSWGPGFGDRGYCYFRYEDTENGSFASDFWVVRKMEGGQPDPPPTPRPKKICPWW